MKVKIIILNWNKPESTIRCIESCLGQGEIVVIDNGSIDGSVKKIRDRFHDIEIIENRENLGYVANNIGLRKVFSEGADAALLLNNDVTLKPDTVEKLKDGLWVTDVGVVAPKILRLDRCYYFIESLGTDIDWLKMRPYGGYWGTTDFKTDGILQKDIFVGCAFLITKELFEKIGGFDESFFIYHEDADYCLRAKENGFVNVCVTGAVAYHGGSETMKDYSDLVLYYSTRNFLKLAEKHGNLIQRLLVCIGVFMLSIKYLIQKRPPFFYGILDYFTGRMGKCTRF